jgi:rSAM/selenodomain-associated transferase 2
MDQPKFSIIVPVLHEVERINDLIGHLRHLDLQGSCEIIVVDGSPERDTLQVIQDKAVIKIPSEKGRARQMNAGASAARGDILIFLHADTELPLHAFTRMNTIINRKEYVGGAFNLGIKSDKWIFKVIAFLASFRSRLSRIPFGDQGIFIRRHYFNEIGGYKEIPLMEDVELMRRIKRSGSKIWIYDDRVMTSSRRWEKEGIIYCTFRNYTNQLLYFLGVSPRKLIRFYNDDEIVKSGKREKMSC